MGEDMARITALRQHLGAALLGLPGVELNGDPLRRVPGILNVSIDGVEGESLLFALRDLAVSSGSACSSTHAEPSYVLRALGRSDRLAQSSLRLSLGRFTTRADIDYAATRIREEVTRLRAGAPAPASVPELPGDDPRYAPEVGRRFRDMPGSAALPSGLPLCTGAAGDVEQGARVELQLAVAGDRVQAARFAAFGCPHLLAAASWLTERLAGLERTEVVGWDWQAAATALEVPPG
jgi:cysteine desulfurase